MGDAGREGGEAGGMVDADFQGLENGEREVGVVGWPDKRVCFGYIIN